MKSGRFGIFVHSEDSVALVFLFPRFAAVVVDDSCCYYIWVVWVCAADGDSLAKEVNISITGIRVCAACHNYSIAVVGILNSSLNVKGEKRGLKMLFRAHMCFCTVRVVTGSKKTPDMSSQHVGRGVNAFVVTAPLGACATARWFLR